MSSPTAEILVAPVWQPVVGLPLILWDIWAWATYGHPEGLSLTPKAWCIFRRGLHQKVFSSSDW